MVAAVLADPRLRPRKPTHRSMLLLREHMLDRAHLDVFAFNPRGCGLMMSIDGKERWLIHNFRYHGETDYDSADRDWAIPPVANPKPSPQAASTWGKRVVEIPARPIILPCGTS
jgi:hypothetical protein